MPNETQQARLAWLQAGLAEQTARLVSSQGWADWLKTAAKFRAYSANNVIAIMWQKPDATLVAGFQRWKQLGRSVNRGETAIWINAPITRRYVPDPGAADGWRPLSKGEKPAQNVPVTFRLVNVKPVPVFDVTQTSGEPLPGWEERHPRLLEGQAPAGLQENLVKFIESRGFTVCRGDCGGGTGVTDYTEKTVTVRPDLDDAQVVETLAHELGHVLLHKPADLALSDLALGEKVWRGIFEVEAESVAYLVLAEAGMDSAAYTQPYVAGWAEAAAKKQGLEIGEVIKATGERVLQAANQIIGQVLPAQPDPISRSIAIELDSLQPKPGQPAPEQPAPRLWEPDHRWRAERWETSQPGGPETVYVALPAGSPEAASLREALCRAAAISSTETGALEDAAQADLDPDMTARLNSRRRELLAATVSGTDINPEPEQQQRPELGGPTIHL